MSGRFILGRPIRFLAAGALNTAVGLTLYPLMLWSVPLLRTHYLIALGIAQAACLMFAFATYKLGVFRTRGGLGREFALFSSFYVVNYAANWAALPALVELGGIHPIIAQTAFTVVLIAGSWLWHSRVTFKYSGDEK